MVIKSIHCRRIHDAIATTEFKWGVFLVVPSTYLSISRKQSMNLVVKNYHFGDVSIRSVSYRYAIYFI